MSKVSAEYRQARRRQIAGAAVQVILRNGVHRTTLADITAESGLSSGAIYTHFASKDEIIAAVAMEAIDAVLEDVDELTTATPVPPPIELVRLITSSIPNTGVDTRLIVQLWGEAITNPVVHETANRNFARVGEALTRYLSLWLTQQFELEEEQARERAIPLAGVLMSLIFAFILQASLLDGFDDEVVMDEVDRLFSRYTVAEEPEPTPALGR